MNPEIACSAHVPSSPVDHSPTLQLHPKGPSPRARELLALIAIVVFMVAIPFLIAADYWWCFCARPRFNAGALDLLIGTALLVTYAPTTALGRQLKARWLSRRAAKRYPGTVPTHIASAENGIVRIEGSGRLLEPLVTPGGVLALGYRDAALRTISGSICVRDGSGMNAVICTEWVEMAGELRFDGEWLIPDDAHIEVSGRARRVAVPEVANGAFRSVPCVLEFVGTREEPVVIRIAQTTVGT